MILVSHRLSSSSTTRGFVFIDPSWGALTMNDVGGDNVFAFKISIYRESFFTANLVLQWGQLIGWAIVNSFHWHMRISATPGVSLTMDDEESLRNKFTTGVHMSPVATPSGSFTFWRPQSHWNSIVFSDLSGKSVENRGSFPNRFKILLSASTASWGLCCSVVWKSCLRASHKRLIQYLAPFLWSVCRQQKIPPKVPAKDFSSAPSVERSVRVYL